MNVLQILTTANPQTVVEAHNAAFHASQAITLETYMEFLAICRGKVLEQSTDVVEIAHYQSVHDDPQDDSDRFDVSRIIVGEDEPYSLSFQPWSKLLACEVRCDIPTYFPLEVQAAYLFWEITWHGFEEETIERKDQLDDIVEDLHRAIEEREEAGDPEAPLRNTTQGSSNIWDDLFPDDTPEERAEREADTQRHLANSRTQRVFKNGIEQKKDAPREPQPE